MPIRPDKEMAFVISNIQSGEGLTTPDIAITPDVVLFYLLQTDSIQRLVRSRKGDPAAFIKDLRAELHKEKPSGSGEERESGEFNEMIYHLISTLSQEQRDEFSALDVLFEISKSARHKPASTTQKILETLQLHPEEIKSMANQQATARIQEETGVENWIQPMGLGSEPWVPVPALLASLAQGLARRKKHHVMLVADPGVGKTALLEGVGRMISENKAPAGLQDLKLFSLDWAALVAGANFRGDVEKRFSLIEAYLGTVGPGATLVLDDLHHFLNLGQQGQMDPIGLLLPIMRRGQVRLIASLTPDRLNQLIERMPGFLNQFQKVEIEEPTAEVAIDVTKAWIKDYQGHHRVGYSDEVIQRACDLVVRHLPDRRLPEKLLDVLDEAGARVRNMAAANRVKPQVSIQDVEQVIATAARLPLAQLAANDLESMRTLDVRLKSRVFGQNEAIEVLTKSIRRSRAGLGRGGVTKPMGVFLFAGPTGVGKTEIAKQLSETLAMPLVRFDMSEFAEAHTISKLIGAPPGYMGYQNGGQLAAAVLKNPCAVVLLDEFEKAHSSLHNLFLQVMDDGFLTDGTGRKVDFRQTILILTSNLGATEAKRRSIGFGTQVGESEENRQSVIDKFMSPEFRNRIDRQVIFSPLSREVMVSVVDRQLGEFANQASARKVKLTFGQSLRDYLAEKGYNPEFGARPLLRLIEEEVQTPLAEEMLFGRLSNGGSVELGIKNKILTFTWPEKIIDSIPAMSGLTQNNQAVE